MARILFAWLTLVALLGSPLASRSELLARSIPEETLEGLKAEVEAARKKQVDDYQQKVREILASHEKAVSEAKTDQEKAKAAAMPALPSFNMAKGLESFSPRFLEWSKSHPDDPKSLDAIVLALETSGRLGGDQHAFEAALSALLIRFATDSRIRPVLKSLGRQHTERSDQLLREVAGHHPDRKTQALALKALSNSLRAGVSLAEFAQGEGRNTVYAQLGREYVEAEVANATKHREEAEKLERLLSQSYSDVLPDLTIGKQVPEVISQTVDGKETRLSAFKGKVIVLDIWATWCGPCKAMIPHEREMVERLKDEPFALVSVSGDEEVDTLKRFLEKESMPWHQWWSGRKSGIIEDWDIEQYPTTFVIDSQGVIRFRDLRDKELEDAVKLLLEEARKA